MGKRVVNYGGSLLGVNGEGWGWGDWIDRGREGERGKTIALEQREFGKGCPLGRGIKGFLVLSLWGMRHNEGR
jgi:hypothetical protein